MLLPKSDLQYAGIGYEDPTEMLAFNATCDRNGARKAYQRLDRHREAILPCISSDLGSGKSSSLTVGSQGQKQSNQLTHISRPIDEAAEY